MHSSRYHLAIHHVSPFLIPASRSERCCANPTVSSDLRGTVLRYSCSLTVADPAHLLLELQPTHNAKTFDAHRHSEQTRNRVHSTRCKPHKGETKPQGTVLSRTTATVNERLHLVLEWNYCFTVCILPQANLS